MSQGGMNYGNDGFLPKRPGKRGTGLHGGSLAQWIADSGPQGGYEKVMSGTFNVQTNVDVRLVATIDKFLDTLGVVPRGVSEMLKFCLQGSFTEAINSGTEIFTDVEEALEWLDARGYRLDQFRGRKRKRLGMALLAQEIRSERRNDLTTVGGLEATVRRLDMEDGKLNKNNPQAHPWVEIRTAELVRDSGMELFDATMNAMLEANELGIEELDRRLSAIRHQEKELIVRSAMEMQNRPREEIRKTDIEIRTEERIRELILVEKMTSREATQLALNEFEAERKKRHAEIYKYAPDINSLGELTKWLREEGYTEYDAPLVAKEIVEKRKELNEIEKLPEASIEELLQVAELRKEEEKRKREELHRITLEMVRSKGQLTEEPSN